MLFASSLFGCATAPAAAPEPVTSGATLPMVSGDGSGVGADQKPFDNDVSALVGHPAPPWMAATWFNSPPLTVESLRGRVVFVRWFMGPTCPLCNASQTRLFQLGGDQ